MSRHQPNQTQRHQQETSPVITNRVVEWNLGGSVGRPPKDTQVKIVHPETGKRLPMYVLLCAPVGRSCLLLGHDDDDLAH